MSEEPLRPHLDPSHATDSYQALLARECQFTWERAQAAGESISPLIDRSAWSQHQRAGPWWWQPRIDPEITWGKELAFVLREARGRVLELGCGGGWLALELARRGLQVTALDACEPLLKAARENAQRLGILPSQLEFRTADLNTISLPANTYDTVIAWHSLHHLLALPRLMQEVRKTLWPGGSLLLCEALLDHQERSWQRSLLAAGRKAAKLALLLLAQAGKLKWPSAATAAAKEEEPAVCKLDSPFEGVGSLQVEPALEAQFKPVQSWRSRTWFWEGLPQYAFTTMSDRRWQQRAAVASLALLRRVDQGLLWLGFRGNCLTGKFVPR